MFKLLSHPLTRDLNIDSPETTHLRRRIIQEKKFLHRVYEEWYRHLINAIPKEDGIVLEIGSGAGFFKNCCPGVITSECFHIDNIDLVIDAIHLPFADESLKAIVMTNVFHHLPQPGLFLQEAARCLIPGGVVAMVEPWVTPWSRFVYSKSHHEPFLPEENKWEIEGEGPLSGANGALPWMIFQRDRKKFENEFPRLKVRNIEPMMPFRYLLSGGVSLISLQPAWTFRFWRFLERLTVPWIDKCAMFAKVIIVKTK